MHIKNKEYPKSKNCVSIIGHNPVPTSDRVLEGLTPKSDIEHTIGGP